MFFDLASNSEALTPGDRAIIDYISAHPDDVLRMSSRELAEAVYVSSPTVIRFCRKAGYEKFGDMKIALARELDDESAFESLDADFPNLSNSSASQVAARVSSLEREAVRKTERLFQEVNWEPIARALETCGGITLYAIGYSFDSCHLFAHDMCRLGVHVTMVEESSRQLEWAALCPRDEFSIFLSYSGIPTSNVDIATILYRRGLKTLSITSDDKSSLAQITTWHVPIARTQKVMAYDRVANIQAHAAQCYALNVLYSLYVSRNYQKVQSDIRAGLERQGVHITRGRNGEGPTFSPASDEFPDWVKRRQI